MRTAESKTVTITLGPECHTPNFVNIQEGEKIKLSRNSWRIASHRIKTKQMVHRLLKKEYYPYFIVTKSQNGFQETTLTVKPYNF